MHFVIVGTTHMARHLIERVLEMGDRLTIVERSVELCRELLKSYRGAAVIYGKGSNSEILKKAGVETADVLIAATDSDGTNIAISKLANNFGVPQVIAIINNPKNRIEVVKAGADTVICPTESALALFESAIKRVDAVTLLHKEDEDYKVVEFTVQVDSPLIGRNLSEIELPEKSRVGMIRRGGEMIFPVRNLVLMAGDRLFIHGTINDVEEAVRKLRSLS